MTRPAHMSPAQRGNVVPIRPGAETMASPFDRLTTRLVLARYRNGTLPEGVLVALLAGVGVHQ